MNGEPRTTLSPLAAIVGALAGLSVGALVAAGALRSIASTGMLSYFGGDRNPELFTGMSTLVALAGAAALAVPLRHRISGWPVAAAGLVATGVLLAVALDSTRDHKWIILILAALSATCGIALLGTLGAAAAASGASRPAITAGLALGLVIGPELYTRLAQLVRPGETTGNTLLLPSVALALVVVATLIDRSRFERAAPEPAVAEPTGTAGLLIGLGVAGLLLLGGTAVLRTAYESLRVSVDGLASPRRTEFVQNLSYHGAWALAVLVTLVLTWAAYRRGRADLARWTVLAFGAAGPLAYGLRVEPDHYLGLFAAVTVAAAAGALLVHRADRWLPWDALGLCLAAAGVLAGLVAYRQGPSWWTTGSLLLGAGLGLALGAGATRALRTAEGGQARVTGSLALGFAALLLSTQALAPVVFAAAGSRGPAEIPLTVPALAAGAAVVLLALFGLGRAVARVRADIRAQAQAPAEPAA